MFFFKVDCDHDNGRTEEPIDMKHESTHTVRCTVNNIEHLVEISIYSLVIVTDTLTLPSPSPASTTTVS